jgi:hypothetical protein
MAPRIIHTKVSGKPAGIDPNRIYGTHWDADHTILGLTVGTDVQAHSLNLDALSALDATVGVVVETAANTFTKRVVTGTANEVGISNGDGVAGNPTAFLPVAITLTGKTLIGGSFLSPSVTTPTGIVKADVGLGNVDNTSDVNKPISTAAASAFALKAPLASPSLTGVPVAPTAAVDTNTTQIATTAMVLAQAASATPLIDATVAVVGVSTRFARGDHVHPTDTTRAPLASPALTGVPVAPTASALNNSTQISTTAYADAAVSTLSGTTTSALALKAPLASAALTGTPTAPTATPSTNTTQIATTAYADAINALRIAAEALKAPLASPALTGVPVAPTAAVDTNTTQLATTAMVLAQASSTTPIIGTTAGAVGTTTRFARADHVHPQAAIVTDLASITPAQGDILYRNASNWVNLGAGTSGQFLKTQGAAANPLWASVPGGGDMLKANNLSDVISASISRANLGVPASNVLINPDFRINQRNQVSGTALSASAYGHDRWKAGAGGATYTFTQLASSTPITITAGTLIQVVEDKNVEGGGYVLSWTGTAQARAGVNSATPSGSYAASPLIVSSQTAGTVMSVEFNAGTLGKVKCEIGSVPTPFFSPDYDVELHKCQRYYRIICPPGAGVGDGGTNVYFTVSHTGLRTIPTVGSTAVFTLTDILAANFTQSSVSFSISGTSSVDGGIYKVGNLNAATTSYRAYFFTANVGLPTFSAEL